MENSDFIDVSNELSTASYFTTVYNIRPKWWANYQFGGNQLYVSNSFENAGSSTGISPSMLYTVAVGEGLQYNWARRLYGDVTGAVNSFQYFGLDFFGSEAPNLIRKGYLRADFNEGDEYTSLGVGKRFESAQDIALGGTRVYPVNFKTIALGVEGFSASFHQRWDMSTGFGNKLGFSGTPTQDQNFFWSYVLFSAGTGGVARENFQKIGQWDFTTFKGFSYSDNPKEPISKAYQRYVTWRYIKLAGSFSK